MSTFRACDWCHEPIGESEPQASLMGLTVGCVTRASVGFGQYDYHASTERDCFAAVRASIELAHELNHQVAHS